MVRAALIAVSVVGCAPVGPGAASASIVDGAPADDAFAVAIAPRRVHCEDDRATATCTGVLIAPRVVLTAAHCVRPPNDRGGAHEVFFGDAIEAGGAYVTVAGLTVDAAYDPETGEHDAAVLWLAEDAPVAPRPLDPVAPDALAPGAPLRAIGFGVTGPRANDPGTRRDGTLVLGEVRAASFDAAPGPAMSCEADSGGPVLATVGGVERIVGITSSGDPGCATRAVNVRVDVLVDGVVADGLAAAAAAGPAWPDDAIDLGAIDATPCETDADCPALLPCVERGPGEMRCALTRLGPGRLGAACDRDDACPSGECARVWHDGPDACRCFEPPAASGGGCSTGRAQGAWSAAWLAIAVAWARRRAA